MSPSSDPTTARLVAYIDEAGCSGDRYGNGSSEFLAVGAAVMVSADEDAHVEAIFNGARLERKKDRKFKKFSDSNDKDNFVLTQKIAQQRIRIIQVAAHKPSLDGSWIRKNHKNEYQYLMKFALERISWIARDAAQKEPEKNTKCRIVFSEQKMYSYEDMAEYLRKLKGNPTHNCRILWEYLDIPERLDAIRHQNETPIHIADIAASAFHRAIEPKDHGMVDERFEINLAPVLYRKNRTLYGVKLFPTQEIESLKNEGRFNFLKIIS